MLCVITASASALDMRALADSLDQWAGFNLGCVPRVRVTQVKTNKDQVFVYTNKTLSCLSLTPEELVRLRMKVSRWVLGGPNGKVSIYSDGFELSELLTSRVKSRPQAEHYPIPNRMQLGHSLNGQYIALWPSHGVYYNRDEDRWKLQRATMWSTVEDVYTTDYAEQVTQMLERAGATVIWPRARYGVDSAATEIGPSGYPRWAEAARYWLEYKGVPDSVWLPVDKINPAKDSVRNDYMDDLRCHGLWVNWLSGGSSVNPKQEGQGIPLSLCLALHTDGYSEVGDSLTIGTLAIYSRQDLQKQGMFPTGHDRQLNRDLADYVQTQVVEDVRKQFDPTWKRRQLQNAAYAESRYPIVPALLLEILSHKQFADIRHGLNPAFRKTVARAIYKGVGRWIHEQAGTEFIVQPLPVRNMQVLPEKNGFAVKWQATKDSLEATAEPEYFLVEIRENDGDWKSAVKVKRPEFSFTAKRGVRYDIRITAGNEGGTSERSETISACLGDENKPMVLIINAFNRVSGPQWWADSTYAGIIPGTYAIPDGEDGIYIGEQWEFNRALDWISDDDCGWGMCYRDQTGTRQVGNTRDYAVQHGRVLQELGFSFVSTNSTALDSIDSRWDIIDVIYGKDTVTSIPELSTWQGKMLASGALLGTIPRASRTGQVRSRNYNFRFAVTPNPQYLCAENATGQVAKPNERVLARYADSGIPACIMTSKGVIWSVPLESFEDFNSLYKQSIELLLKSK